jgi:hypothetical protein
MKNLLKIGCLVFFILACSNEKTETQVAKLEETVKLNPNTFPIDEIIERSEKRKLTYHFDDVFSDSTKQIPLNFFKKYLANYKVKNMVDFKFSIESYSLYDFFDYAQFNEYVSFTIVYDDESGYDDYFSYIYDKNLDEIVEVYRIATYGADGGHSQTERLYYSNSYMNLLVKTHTLYDEDISDAAHFNCYRRETEKSESRFKFNQGKTTFKFLKTATYADTICQE